MQLKGTYPVTMDGEVVGTVSVSRNGLYYDLFCRCRVDGDQMLDLIIETNQGSRQLGLLAPAGDRLVLQKRIPVKQIGDGICGFILQFRNVKANEFIPVIPDRPFSKDRKSVV